MAVLRESEREGGGRKGERKIERIYTSQEMGEKGNSNKPEYRAAKINGTQQEQYQLSPGL